MRFLAISAAVFVIFAIVASAQADYKVVCYYNSTSWNRVSDGIFKPSNINASLCTHIVYEYAVLDSDTLTIQPQNATNDVDNSYYTQVTALRSSEVNVSISLGGWNDSTSDKYSQVLTNSTARSTFIYPGCWQGDCTSNSSDKDGFSTLIEELYSAFSSNGYQLSATVSSNATIIDAAYDIPTLSEYLDWITLLTFDYHGYWDGYTGYGASLYSYSADTLTETNVNYTVNYWIDGGANSSKLILGIPSYGRSYTLTSTSNYDVSDATSGAGTAGQYAAISGLLSLEEILYRTNRIGWSYVKDSGNATGYYAYFDTQWVSFEDTNTVRVKANYIADNNLGGGSLFHIDLDDFAGKRGCGKYPLLTSLNQVLRNVGGTLKSSCI